jgi:hypothetical protein
MTATDPTLRSVLDAHWLEPFTDIESCACGGWSEMSSSAKSWADHREQAVQMFLDAALTPATPPASAEASDG